MTSRPPAAMSSEAEAFLAATDIPSTISLAEMPIAEIRRLSYEACRMASERAVEAHGVTCADTMIAGVTCVSLMSSAIKVPQEASLIVQILPGTINPDDITTLANWTMSRVPPRAIRRANFF